MKKQTVYLVVAGFLIAALPFAVLKAQTRSIAPASVATYTPPAHAKETPTTEAIALWQHLRDANGAAGTPVSADVVITSFTASGSVHRTVHITMQEGTGGRYRLTYTAPTAVKGRVVVFDGKTLYQYEPTRKVVLKRSVESDETALTDASGNISDSLIPIIEKSDTLNDRKVQVLALHDRQGRLVRRCFVDEMTGRSLRTEEFNPDTHRLLRRVTKENLLETSEPDLTLFEPDFPATARVVSASSHRANDLQKEKRKLGIPETAGNYRLRTVLSPPAKKALPGTANAVHHAVYSNGVHTVSVFITALTAPNATLAPPEGTGWQSVEVNKGTSGFAREDERGRTGVVWLRDGRRYVLAARIPLNDALTMAHDLCRNL
jgi:outer membrane lipoprotein-sorting protein